MSHSAEHYNPAAFNYAEALLNMARRKKNVLQMDEQASVLLEVMAHGNNQMCRFLEGPQIPTQDKLDLVDRVFSQPFDDLLVNLIKMLVRRDRTTLLRGILQIFSEMAAEEQGLRTGRVQTAVSLSDGEKQRIKDSLETFMRQRLSLQFVVEPRVMGGVIFQSGDELIDYSVRGRLEELRKRLEGVRVGN